MKKKLKFNSINNNVLKLFILSFFLYSCETITNIPNAIIQSGSDTIDYVGSIFDGESDVENEENNNNDEQILAAQPIPESKSPVLEKQDENENITDSSQVLDAVPTSELLVEDVKKENTQEFLIDSNTETNDNYILPSDLNTKDSNESIEKKLNNNKIDLPDLNLKNKVQFKIGIINFTSGSSFLSYQDKKKIKKIIKLANKKNATVKIVGHASTRTKDMPVIQHKLANFNISDMRAKSVEKEFILNKFPASNLITEAVSDSKPLFHESMPAGTYGNQRTEIYLIY